MRESQESRCRRNVQCWLQEIQAPAFEFLPADFPGLKLPPFTGQHAYLVWSQELAFYLRIRLVKRTTGMRWADHQPFGLPTAIWSGQEWRATWAAQAIVHEHCGRRLIEIDFDEENPAWGGYQEIKHALRWVKRRWFGGRTNPFRVARKRGWK